MLFFVSMNKLTIAIGIATIVALSIVAMSTLTAQQTLAQSEAPGCKNAVQSYPGQPGRDQRQITGAVAASCGKDLRFADEP